ncbi:hypothetical protein, partial [Limosilactobacillus reuteri]|uniref:hypothetical protein n=1 Tax=Limosilactobacillus reuteri TaxID=1598 RepID=UPI002B0524E2
GILLILGTTWCSSRGMTAIAKVGSLGGIFTIVVNIIFVIVSVFRRCYNRVKKIYVIFTLRYKIVRWSK